MLSMGIPMPLLINDLQFHIKVAQFPRALSFLPIVPQSLEVTMKIFLIFCLLLVSTLAQIHKVECSLSKDCDKKEFCRNHKCIPILRKNGKADRHLADRHRKPTGSTAGDGKKNSRIHHG